MKKCHTSVHSPFLPTSPPTPLHKRGERGFPAHAVCHTVTAIQNETAHSVCADGHGNRAACRGAPATARVTNRNPVLANGGRATPFMAATPNAVLPCGNSYPEGNAALRPCERSEAIRGMGNGEWKIENDGARHFILNAQLSRSVSRSAGCGGGDAPLRLHPVAVHRTFLYVWLAGFEKNPSTRFN
jgi:hypothetical protein